ncbi:hypothetical protein OS493_012008 [Desmophyllum pertusum]|uniref:Uncharacterized protein n=1 Tax=Desmophyllum pertusum TaxID=174260 RepID=A0A9X0A665_9CNID|nr:hypothetical protein OS493_012008 [Desmophyllum pertusum]
MQPAQDSCVIKPKGRRFSTAHARRRARVYSNSIKREFLEEQSADELRISHESSLGTGSAAFLQGLLCDADGNLKGWDQYAIQNSDWIYKTFKRKECIRHVGDEKNPGLCCCGRPENQHGKLTTVQEENEELEIANDAAEECADSDNSQPEDEVFNGTNERLKLVQSQGLPSLVKTSGYVQQKTGGRKTAAKGWSPKEDVKEFPTNGFGHIKFANAYNSSLKPAKYIRLSDNTKPELTLELMVRQWKLKKPDIVISIHGGLKNFKLDPHHKEIFNRGLIKAAKTTNCGAWIITGGVNLGVMKAVGQAVQEGQSMQWGGLSSHRRIRCIGIATWGYVERNEHLISPLEGKGCYPATYRVEHSFQRGKPVSLNPDHTHFLLVDDGTQGQCGAKEVQFRARLERVIADKPNIQRQKFGFGVPVVTVVLEGGEDALKAVKESVKHGIPAVIVEGTRRAADILAFAHHNCECLSGFRRVKEDQLPRLKAKIEESFPNFAEDEKHVQKIIDIVNSCVYDERLITVYKIDEKNNLDLDLAILSALLKAQGACNVDSLNSDCGCRIDSLGQGSSQMDQLKLALTWNRVDVAEDKIFTPDTDWPSGSLDEIMMDALQMDRVDFVKLFLANGVSMRDFLTVPRLRRLYNSAEPGSHLYSLLTNIAGVSDAPYSLKDIGVLIEELVGAYYEPLYLVDTPHTNTLAARVAGLFGAVPNVDGEGGVLSPSVKFQPSDTNGRVQVAHNATRFEKPFRELFLWAVLMNRYELARFMWEKGEEAVSDALAACRLFHVMHEQVEDDYYEIRTELKQHAVEFENLAIGVLDECYDEDEVLAEMLIEREIPKWGGMCALNLAAAAQGERFLAHPCCQSSLNSIWKSRGMPGVPYWKVILGVICPLLILKIVFYDEENHKWSVPMWKKLVIFYNAPISKFWAHVGMHLCFLGLYAFVILFSFHKPWPSVYEIVLLCWVGVIIMDEIRQVIHQETTTIKSKLELYFNTSVNIVDSFANTIFLISFVLRFFEVTWEAARVLYCINFVIFSFRLFRVYFVSGYLGPKIIMIKRMLADVMMWLCLLLVFVCSYGVFRQALFFANKEPYWGVINDLFYKPYWHVYGELFVDQEPEEGKLTTGEIPLHDGNHLKWIHRILMGGYLLITNVLLINLLIAIFSNVFNEVEVNSYQIWKYQYYYLVMEYNKQPPLAPPFAIIFHLVEFVRWLGKKCRKPNKVTPNFTAEDLELLRLFEIESAANYRQRVEEQKRTGTEERIRKTNERVEHLVKKVTEMQETLQLHLTNSNGDSQ